MVRGPSARPSLTPLFRVRKALAPHHVVLKRGQESCYVIWRRDRRKRLPIFACVLDANSPRPKMFPSPTLPASTIDYRYLELTCVAW